MTEIEMNEGASRGLDRRTIIKGAAWSVPVVAAAVVTPFAAATTPQGLLDLNAGCVQIAGVQALPGFSVNNVGTAAYDGTITVVETIDLTAISGGGFVQRTARATIRAALWLVLLVEGTASGASTGVSRGSWVAGSNEHLVPLSYSRTVTITGSIAAGASKSWGNLLSIGSITSVLEGFGLETINRYSTITSPTGNPPVVDGGPSRLDWNLIGGC